MLRHYKYLASYLFYHDKFGDCRSMFRLKYVISWWWLRGRSVRALLFGDHPQFYSHTFVSISLCLLIINPLKKFRATIHDFREKKERKKTFYIPINYYWQTIIYKSAKDTVCGKINLFLLCSNTDDSTFLVSLSIFGAAYPYSSNFYSFCEI